jgi:phosphatidate cytidylyltransferase
VLGPIVLLAIVLGATAFQLLIALAGLILAWEWARLCGETTLGLPGLALGAVMILSVVVAGLGHVTAASLIVIAGAAVLFLLSRGNTWLALGAPYFGLPSIGLLWLRQETVAGQEAVLWLFAVVWASDIGAYACGSTLRGPLLAPRISPRKTWSGFLGGLLATGLAGAAFALSTGLGSVSRLSLLSAAVGLFAQAGDLAESWLKRRFGVKDSSTLIPGHGGMLDRVDGLLTAAMVTALIAAWGNGSIWTWL